MNEYSMLTDNIVNDIYGNKSNDLKKSKEIIKRIKQRDLYKYVSEALMSSDHKLPIEIDRSLV